MKAIFRCTGVLLVMLSVAAAQERPVCIRQYVSGLKSLGMVNIQELDPTIEVDLKYACSTNFMGKNVYGELRECYLQAEAAHKLVKANRILKEIRPDLSLVVADGFRPRHVQRIMWEIVRNTPHQKYVADPSAGSMHNYGCAVDITLGSDGGVRLDMGTPVDYFGPLAEPRLEEQFLRSGDLTKEQVENRRLLRRVMTEAGFVPLSIEWWHFDAFSKAEVRRRFKMVE